MVTTDLLSPLRAGDGEAFRELAAAAGQPSRLRPRTRRACPRPEDQPPVADLASRPSSYPCGQAVIDAP
jgi:hypothetical protein